MKSYKTGKQTYIAQSLNSRNLNLNSKIKIILNTYRGKK